MKLDVFLAICKHNSFIEIKVKVLCSLQKRFPLMLTLPKRSNIVKCSMLLCTHEIR